MRLSQEKVRTSEIGPFNLRGFAYQLLAVSAAQSGERELAREALAEAQKLNPNLALELAAR